jgi:cell division protein FtsL
MCLICVELIKGKLTAREAERNLTEYISARGEIRDTHDQEVAELIDQQKLLERAGTN